MDFGKLPIFDVLARRMGWLGQRQEVLAQNIANADTPDYRPLDLKAAPFERALASQVRPVRLAQSDPGHLSGPRADAGRDFKDGRVPGYETAPAGNAVVLEQQLVSVAETQMDFQMMTSLYRKHLDMFRTALGRSGGSG
ncbi:MAG: flagellar basal body protein [Kiloniellales bacterium]|nr:flagellar basal body protein [Kiloniellales bacterium]